jgi:hypothetical protein
MVKAPFILKWTRACMDSHRLEMSQVVASSYPWNQLDTKKKVLHMDCSNDNPTFFALVVDNFLVQYSSHNDLHHLQAILRQYYQITVDMEASKLCGMTLDFIELPSGGLKMY